MVEICASYINISAKGLIHKTYKELMQLSTENKQTAQLKINRGTAQTVYPEKIFKHLQVTGKGVQLHKSSGKYELKSQ